MSTENAAASTAQIPPAGTYRLDPTRSSISFETRHMFGLGAVKGTFAVASGDLVIADPVTGSSLVAAADAASFATGTAKRDEHVRSKDFLHVEQHPQITFRSTSVARSAEGWTVDGELTARGVTAPLTLSVTATTVSGDDVTIRASAKVDRYAHQILKSKGMAARFLTLQLLGHATRA